MVLVISGTLISAQISVSKTPFLQIVIHTNEGVSTETFDNNSGSNQIIYMREDHQVWAGELEILLFNGDQGLAAKDYTGRRVMPSWGYTTGSGDEKADHAPYWVVDQEFVAFAGTSYLKLTCWSVWDMMGVKAAGGDAADAVPIINGSFDTNLSAIVDNALDSVLLVGFTGAGIPLVIPGAALDETAHWISGGIFKEYRPQLAIEWGQSVRSIIRGLMDLTFCGLRMRTAAMHVLYPADADAVTATYQSGAFEVLAAALHTSVAIPNRIIYVDKQPDTVGDQSTHKGIAEDSGSQGRVGLITQIFSPTVITDIGNNISGGNNPIAGDDEAQQRADTILSSIQHEASEGIFTTHPNVALEVWDKVSVIDSISGVTTGGRVGRIETIWDATGLAADGARYIQNVELGGLTIRASNLSAYVSQTAFTGVELGEGEQAFLPPLPGQGGLAPSLVSVPGTLENTIGILIDQKLDRFITQDKSKLSEEFPFITVDPPGLKIDPDLLERRISRDTGIESFRPPTAPRPTTPANEDLTPAVAEPTLGRPRFFSRRFWSDRLRRDR